MKSSPLVSIIIPLHVISDRFFTDLKKFSFLDYKNFEILIVVDSLVKLPPLPKIKIRVLKTGKKNTGPAEKRDFAIKKCLGELCAFIDDDAYPDPAWLKNCVDWFKNPQIVAVGGPGLTPKEDSRAEKIGGHIISSYLCSGGVQHRYYVDKLSQPKFTDDWPAYNLIIKKSSLTQVGGFASQFYGGEDTYVCMKLKQIGLIVFDPKVVVYHHRRRFPLSHLKQISNVGLHRGYFFKAYPDTSRRLIYLAPTVLTTLLFAGLLLTVYLPSLFLLPFGSACIFLLALASFSVYRHGANMTDSLFAGLGIIITHATYGIYFLKGIWTKKLIR